MVNGFDAILQRAIERKGGRAALDELLPEPLTEERLIDNADRNCLVCKKLWFGFKNWFQS